MEQLGDSAYVVLNEVFDSIQGEGVSAGAPRTFVRLSGCNLACSYCDTPYTWDFARFDKRAETYRMPLAALRQRLDASVGVVLTGGEPLLQQRRLAELLPSLRADLAIEVETNGTIAPAPELLQRVDQWNVSPKLSSAGQPLAKAIVYPALRALNASGRMWLKFVVDRPEELEEIASLCAELAFPRDRVLLQTEAITRERLLAKSPRVLAWCNDRGYRFSPRLHVAAWGALRGR